MYGINVKNQKQQQTTKQTKHKKHHTTTMRGRNRDSLVQVEDGTSRDSFQTKLFLNSMIYSNPSNQR